MYRIFRKNAVYIFIVIFISLFIILGTDIDKRILNSSFIKYSLPFFFPDIKSKADNTDKTDLSKNVHFDIKKSEIVFIDAIEKNQISASVLESILDIHYLSFNGDTLGIYLKLNYPEKEQYEAMGDSDKKKVKNLKEVRGHLNGRVVKAELKTSNDNIIDTVNPGLNGMFKAFFGEDHFVTVNLYPDGNLKYDKDDVYEIKLFIYEDFIQNTNDDLISAHERDRYRKILEKRGY